MHGVAVAPRHRLGAEKAGSLVRIAVGNWTSGLYFARVTSATASSGMRRSSCGRRLGERPWPSSCPRRRGRPTTSATTTATGDPTRGTPGNGNVVHLFRPFLNRGVPYRFRHYDLPFLHWLARTRKQVDFLADGDLARIGTPQARGGYDLIVFPGTTST